MKENVMLFPPRAGLSVDQIVTAGGWGPETTAVMAIAKKFLGVRLDLESHALRASLNDGTVGHLIETALGFGLYRDLSASGVTPTLITGHSMGLYSAITAAGCLSLEAAFELLTEHFRAFQSLGGSMAIVMGLPLEAVAEICEDLGEIWVSGKNAPQLCTLSGTLSGMARFEVKVADTGAKVLRKDSFGPWHCPLGQDIVRQLRQSTERTLCSDAKVPVLVPMETPRLVTDRQALVQAVVDQAVSPVSWAPLCHELLQRENAVCIEVGARPIISKFLQHRPLLRNRLVQATDLLPFTGA